MLHSRGYSESTIPVSSPGRPRFPRLRTAEPWTSDLRGRDAEVDRLTGILDGAEPDARVITISGDPWSGKSELLTVFADLARARGWTVACGAAGPLPVSLPFGVFSDALDDLPLTRHPALLEGFPKYHVSWLAGIYPALAQYAPEATMPSNPSEMQHVFHAIRALLERLSSTERLLLVIDDMHWADEASVDLVKYLVRNPPDARVLLVTALRPRQTDSDLRTMLDEASASGRAAHISLSPLTDDDLATLLPPEVSPARRGPLLDAADGNPGLLRALAAVETTADGSEDTESGRAELPVSLLREFRTLSPFGWTVAHAAALVREPFDTRLLEAVAQTGEAEIWAGVDELVQHDILRLDGSERTFRFRNSLLRATAYRAAGAAWRLGAHARAAAALRIRNAPPPQIARHLGHCVLTEHDDTVRILVDAARAVRWEQPEDTASWLRAVLDLHQQASDEDRAEQLSLLAAALTMSGRLAESRALFDQLPSGGETALWTGQVLRLDGRHAEADELLRTSLRALPAQAHRTRARLSAALLATTLEAGHVPAAPDEEILEHLAGPDDAALRVLLLALNTLADGSASYRSDDWMREARALVAHLSDDVLARQIDTLYWLARAESRRDRDDLARGHLERALELAARYGQHYVVPQLTTLLGSVSLSLGDRDGAERHACRAWQAARRIGSEFQVTAATRLRELIDRPRPAPEAQPPVTVADEPDLVPPQDIPSELEQLSGREREISRLVSDGRTNQQIARALGLSHKTVETYLARIFKKLALCSRAQLATIVGRSVPAQ